MKSNLMVRAFSGAVLVAVIVGMLWFTNESRYIILSIIGVAGCWEFITLFKHSGALRCYTTFSGVVILLANYFNIELTPIVVTLFAVRAIYELYRSKLEPLSSISYEVLSIIYCILPMMLLYNHSLLAIYSVIILVWINDVGAYLVGSKIGKRKLFERLSPKKSWEGFWGGFLFCILGGYAITLIFESESALYWIAVAVTVSIFAVFGDLFESMLKRSLKIKDSGNIIPGHGGVLDRFDALYFASMGFYLVDTLFTIITK